MLVIHHFFPIWVTTDLNIHSRVELYLPSIVCFGDIGDDGSFAE